MTRWTGKKYSIRKVRPDAPWSWTGLWLLLCRECGRRHHHAAWEDAMLHASLHDCTPGSIW